MYQFRKLSGRYIIDIQTNSVDGTKSIYSAQMLLSGRYQSTDDNYLFELVSREKVLLNNAPVTQVADLFMLRLSNTYYPMKLKVSAKGEIIDIANFDAIKERWENEVKKIMTKTPCIAYEQYIDSVKSNLDSRIHFLEAIRKDSFIQLYFTNFEGVFCVTCNNFPTIGEVLYYQFCGHSSKKGYVYESEEDNCKGMITCEFSEYMDIVSLASEFVYVSPEGQYMKSIHIRSKEWEAKKSNRLISFLMD